MHKFLIDESSGRKLFEFLRDAGYEVRFVTDIMPTASDEEVLTFAEKEDRILITNDKDFGEIIFRLNRPSSGVILLRLKDDFPQNRQKYISNILENFSDKLKSNFIIVTENRIKIRKIK